MEVNDLENAIIAFVSRPRYSPIKPRAIAKRLGLNKEEAQEAKRVIKRLVRVGRLAYGANHLVQRIAAAGQGGAAQGSQAEGRRRKDKTGEAGDETGGGRAHVVADARPNVNRVIGVFRRAEGGYGFVRPSSTAGDAPAGPDIYIPADRTGDAAPGDIVAVRLKGHKGRRPGPRGEILEVVERQSQRFVGTYFESAGTGCVQVDGSAFGDPVAVGDPGARGARIGDKVVVEMLRFPTASRRGEGVIVEVLGPLGKPGVDTLSILREFNLPEEFPHDVLEEARRQAELFTEEIPEGRYDATGETIVTIDPIDARDFDDAISLVQIEGGHWRLGVHIADVSHFVRPRTALDREARARATSVYLPDRVIPMLPELISNGLASLQPEKVRYTKTAYIEFSPEGEPVGAEFHSAAIRSSKRLTYEQVDEFLADPKAARGRLGAGVCDLLGRMRDLARLLRARRIRRGALEMNMPEVKVELDRQGRVTGARVMENTESHQIIEEFMLAANVAVAEMLEMRGLSFLRRIHKEPTLLKLQALSEFVAELGFPADDLASRFALQKLLDSVAGAPQQHAVHYAVLRSLQRAVYSPKEEGHFALACDCYCHFTSPIRRYPDLTVHRLFEAILEGKPPRQDPADLSGLGDHCSNQEQRAEQAERQLTRLKLLQYFSTRIGEEMDAVITGVERYGLFVEGTPLPAEGLVHIDSLVDDYYDFDRTTHTLSGRRGNAFRLGDVVRVAVSRVDLERRELDFRLVSRSGDGRPGQDGRREGAARRRGRLLPGRATQARGASEGQSAGEGAPPPTQRAKSDRPRSDRTTQRSDGRPANAPGGKRPKKRQPKAKRRRR